MTEQNITKTDPELAEPTATTQPDAEPQAQPNEDKRFTQAELDAIVRDRLAREKANREKAEKETREKAEADALAKNQEWEKLAAQREKELNDIKADNERLQTEGMQRKAAEAAGLPSIFADRIRGGTAEEMEADAKALLEAMPKKPAANSGASTNPSGGTNAKETDAERRRRLGL